MRESSGGNILHFNGAGRAVRVWFETLLTTSGHLSARSCGICGIYSLNGMTNGNIFAQNEELDFTAKGYATIKRKSASGAPSSYAE